MSRVSSDLQSIAVIGAGIIGLSSALELADRGAHVTLYETHWPPRGASWAAAGMLAPAFEAAAAPGTHPRLFELCDASARLWPDWSARLETQSGRSAGYFPGPSLAIALTSAEVAKLDAVQSKLSGYDFAPQDCLDRLREVEPAIGANACGALLLPSDGQADNRATLKALLACVEKHEHIDIRIGEAPLRATASGIDHAGHDATLIAAGWRSAKVAIEREKGKAELAALEPLFEDIHACGGQMLAVAPAKNGPRLTVRSGHIYVVPKPDRIIIGATTEPGRTSLTPDPSAIDSLRQAAIEICPALADAKVIESWAGVRPGTRDHAPILGETSIPGLFVAAGHYRNGILLAPLTANIMADLILDQISSDLARAFSPQARFAEQL